MPPVGPMANVTSSVACYNFGVLEHSPFNARLQGSRGQLNGGCALRNLDGTVLRQ